MSNTHDFPAFIEEVKNKDYPEILEYSQERAARADRASHAGGAKAHSMKSAEFARKIKEFRFWMINGRKPGSAKEKDFQLYKVVAEALVKKGQLKTSVLDMFQ